MYLLRPYSSLNSAPAEAYSNRISSAAYRPVERSKSFAAAARPHQTNKRKIRRDKTISLSLAYSSFVCTVDLSAKRAQALINPIIFPTQYQVIPPAYLQEIIVSASVFSGHHTCSLKDIALSLQSFGQKEIRNKILISILICALYMNSQHTFSYRFQTRQSILEKKVLYRDPALCFHEFLSSFSCMV